VRDEDGNILIYSANVRGDRGNVGIIRSPVRSAAPQALLHIMASLEQRDHNDVMAKRQGDDGVTHLMNSHGLEVEGIGYRTTGAGRDRDYADIRQQDEPAARPPAAARHREGTTTSGQAGHEVL
jgi:hypothetical protein